MLSSLAISAPESSQLGPYAVTLDMNTEMQYEMIPLEAESLMRLHYSLQVVTDNSTCKGGHNRVQGAYRFNHAPKRP